MCALVTPDYSYNKKNSTTLCVNIIEKKLKLFGLLNLLKNKFITRLQYIRFTWIKFRDFQLLKIWHHLAYTNLFT
jgi:hypothetical protein